MRVCHRCHRHVRETLCPFCGAVGNTHNQAPPARLPVGVARGALLVGALAAGSAVESCAPGAPGDGGAATDASDASAVTDGADALDADASVGTMYGLPPLDVLTASDARDSDR